MSQEQELNLRENPLILIVDDEPDNFDVIEALLGGDNYDLLYEPNSDKALKIFRETNPDLVILDVMMPGINGINLCRELRKESGVPIVMITALSSAEDEYRCIANGADYFISKPVNRLRLRDIVESAINKSILVRENARVNNINIFLKKENQRLENNIKHRSDNQLIFKEKERYKIVFSAIIHNLKNEFVNISNSTHEIQESVINSSDIENIQEEFNVIERSVESSHILLRRLLNYLNTDHCQIQPISIGEILKKIELIVRPRLTSNIELNISIEHEIEHKEINIDLEQIMLVLTELIGNATKALRNLDKGVINIFFRYQSNQLAISIEDNGSGIPQNIREKLFDEPVVSSEKRLGIGLFLCHKIIKNLRGKLDLETSNKGTKYTIILPIVTPD